MFLNNWHFIFVEHGCVALYVLVRPCRHMCAAFDRVEPLPPSLPIYTGDSRERPWGPAGVREVDAVRARGKRLEVLCQDGAEVYRVHVFIPCFILTFFYTSHLIAIQHF